MNDLISRQAAIDAIEEIHPVDTEYDCTLYDKMDVMYVLTDLPSVKPQPKTGHWIHFASGDDCSECGWSTGKYESPSKYCPNCGARMVEPQESEE